MFGRMLEKHNLDDDTDALQDHAASRVLPVRQGATLNAMKRKQLTQRLAEVLASGAREADKHEQIVV